VTYRKPIKCALPCLLFPHDHCILSSTIHIPLTNHRSTSSLCHLHFVGCHFVRHFYMKANLDTTHLVRTSCAPLKLFCQLLSSLPPSPTPISTRHLNAMRVALTLPAGMRPPHATKSIPMTIRSVPGKPP
jgi:hypothetical protein